MTHLLIFFTSVYDATLFMSMVPRIVKEKFSWIRRSMTDAEINT